MAIARIANFDIHVEVFEPERPSAVAPIVLLHEGLGSIAGWGSFPRKLAEASARVVFAYDRRGYGMSDPWHGPWPSSFLQDEARSILCPFVAEVVGAQPILVGHSDGASIALAYPAHREVEAPSPLGIVSIAAHVFVEEVSIAAVNLLRHEASALAQRLERQHSRPEELIEAWIEIWTSDRMRNWSLEADLHSVSCPVRAIQGADDRYGTGEQLRRIAAAVQGPVDVFELPGVDHWPHREATDHVLALITDFCYKVDPGPPSP